MNIRPIMSNEIHFFDEVWAEYLEENRKEGDVMLPVEENRKFFHDVASYYTNSPEFGCVMTAFTDTEVAGIVLWGGIPWGQAEIKTSLGYTANGWGTFVRPAYRGEKLSTRLREAAARYLANRGFDTLLGAVDGDRKPARMSVWNFGFVPRHTVVTLDLTEDKWRT